MDIHYITNYEKTLKRFILSTLLLVTTCLVTGGLMYYDTYPISYFLLILVFIMLFSSAIVYVVPISYTKKLIKFFYIFLFVALFPITVFYLTKGIATAVFWYFPIPITIYTIYNHKKAIRWSILCLATMILAFITAFIIRQIYFEDNFVHLSYKHLMYSDMVNACFSILLVFMCLFYLHKFHHFKISHIADSVNKNYSEKTNDSPDTDNVEEYKFTQIYTTIEEYFETKKPYLDPDFKMVQMAHELNINIVYLAKAIKLNKNMNFNNFVNEYRIEKVKELINNDPRKYTLKYIYLSSGFKNQSSFNKAFKLKEGITPSEYYKLNKEEVII